METKLRGRHVKIVKDRYNDADWIGRTGKVVSVWFPATEEETAILQSLDLWPVAYLVRVNNAYKIRGLKAIAAFREEDLEILDEALPKPVSKTTRRKNSNRGRRKDKVS